MGEKLEKTGNHAKKKKWKHTYDRANIANNTNGANLESGRVFDYSWLDNPKSSTKPKLSKINLT